MRCCRRCWTGRFGRSCERRAFGSRNPRKSTKGAKVFRAFRFLSHPSCSKLPSTNSAISLPTWMIYKLRWTSSPPCRLPPRRSWMRCCRRCWTGRFGGSCERRAFESRKPRKSTKGAKVFRAFRFLSRPSCSKLPSTNSVASLPTWMACKPEWTNSPPCSLPPRRSWMRCCRRCWTGRFGGSCERRAFGSRNPRKSTKGAKVFRAFRFLSRPSCSKSHSTSNREIQST